jgi:tetratricopeptide (TPR) repeat protein
MRARVKAFQGGIRFVLLAASLVLDAGAVSAGPAAPAARSEACSTFLDEQLGDHGMPITTRSAEAQRLFDQGLTLSYAFNHDEAARSFEAAIARDPTCAMCYWGLAYVQGPNINSRMAEDRVPVAYEATQKALSLREHASGRERAYIEALAERYAERPPADRSALDRAYADAMGRVARRFPSDLDAWTLFAEALMDTSPWRYWGERGQPTALSRRLVDALERVLGAAPDHPGATHLYIHALETVRPARALDAADRLGTLVPGAGHLVHMPSHIYLRLGRYHDASAANERAIAADRRYLDACGADTSYARHYALHSYDFLVASSSLEGRRAFALEKARELAALSAAAMGTGEHGAGLQEFYASPWLVMVRFGLWDELLAEPAPPKHAAYAQALYHYARSIALARTRRAAGAERELHALEAIAADPALDAQHLMGVNAASDVLAIAVDEASGEIAAARGAYDEAIAHLQAAVEAQDRLRYMEPPPWYRSTRVVLGAVLLEAGRAAKAERVFREDLEAWPRNGWALSGLTRSLEMQGKLGAAEEARAELEVAWARADVELPGPRS